MWRAESSAPAVGGAVPPEAAAVECGGISRVGDLFLEAWIWPEAGDGEAGVGPDWSGRCDLGGSHGRMLLAGGAPAPE